MTARSEYRSEVHDDTNKETLVAGPANRREALNAEANIAVYGWIYESKRI